MKKLELSKMGLQELTCAELSEVAGGNGIFYYIAYDAGFLLGTALRVGQRVAESLYYGTLTK